MKKTFFYIETKSSGALLSMLFMLLSAIIRIIYFCGKELSAEIFFVHFANVILAAIIFIFVVAFYGEKYPQMTVLSVFMGVVFFIVKALDFESRIHTALCIVLYIAVLTIYSLTLFGVIKTKYLLYPLFGLPLLYHVFVEDIKIYFLANPRVPFFEWLPEISVLCIMAALLSVSFALKKR